MAGRALSAVEAHLVYTNWIQRQSATHTGLQAFTYASGRFVTAGSGGGISLARWRDVGPACVRNAGFAERHRLWQRSLCGGGMVFDDIGVWRHYHTSDHTTRRHRIPDTLVGRSEWTGLHDPESPRSHLLAEPGEYRQCAIHQCHPRCAAGCGCFTAPILNKSNGAANDCGFTKATIG